MQGFVPKRPGVQHDIFQSQDIVITDRQEPKLYVGNSPPRTTPIEVDVTPTPRYDGHVISNIVRAYIKWQG